MFTIIKSKQALRSAGLCLAVAGVFVLPHAGARQAAVAVAGQDNSVVVRDTKTGKLRAATPDENNALMGTVAENRDMRSMSSAAVAPAPKTKEYHRSGAVGIRLTRDQANHATVERAADGALVHQCAAGHGDALPATQSAPVPSAASPAPTSVTE